MEELSKPGDPPEKLNKYINREDFRGLLTRTLRKEQKPPFGYVTMFKILILRRMYNAGDDQTEYQIKDRLNFMHFPGLELRDTVPDTKMIRNFREQLRDANIPDVIFYRFTEHLEKKGMITYSNSIADAAFVDAPATEEQPGGEQKYQAIVDFTPLGEHY